MKVRGDADYELGMSGTTEVYWVRVRQLRWPGRGPHVDNGVGKHVVYGLVKNWM